MSRRGETVGAIDFGARALRVLIARQENDGSIEILGHGEAPSRGCIKQGIIQDLNAAKQALKRALSAARKESGISTVSFFCGVNGKNVNGYIREGIVKVEKQTVELHHLEEAEEQAGRDVLAAGKRVAASISAQEWYVDDMRVTDPLGIRASVLKTRMHFVQLPAVIEDNLVQCIESQGKTLEDLAYMPLAASLGCLTPEDLELGVAVIDMGRTTTGLAVYRDRRLYGTHTLDFGGFHITRDVAAGLQVSFEEAVRLVLEYGISDHLIHSTFLEEAPVTDAEAAAASIKLETAVRGAPTVVQRDDLDDIIFERSQELMTKIRQYLHGKGLARHLVRGIVLTGGAAAINNMDRLTEGVFETPARVGLPDGIDHMPQEVNSPSWAPVVGVVRHGFEYREAVRSGRIAPRRGLVMRMVHGFAGLLKPLI